MPRGSRSGFASPLTKLQTSLPPLASAGLLALTFYPTHLEWLVWVALIPLLIWLAKPTLTTRQACVGLFFVGTFYHFYILTPFLSLTWWGWGIATETFFSYQKLFMLVTLFILAGLGGIVLILVGLMIRRRLSQPLVTLWWVSAVWVLGLEYLGHKIVLGFTWGLLGNRLHDCLYLRQLASLTGVYGLSFLVVLINTAIAVAIIHARKSPWRSVLVVVLAALVSFGVWAYGAVAVHRATPPSSSLKVALLQAGQKHYRFEDFTEGGLDRMYLTLLPYVPPADLLVLPETVWLRSLQLDGTTTPWDRAGLSPPTMRAMLAKTFGNKFRIVVFGIDAVQQRQMYNATVYWTSNGLAGTYFKRRLVPFAEYAPWLVGRFAPQNRLHGPGFAYSPGQKSQLVQLNGLTVGSFICQEVMLPPLIRESVRGGAQLLITTGNDGMFASPIVALEQANLAKLRAVENRRFLLRAMKSGVTAIIDPFGHEVAKAQLHVPAIVGGEAQAQRELTWYTRYGEWFVGLCGLIVLIGLVRKPQARLAS